MPGNYYDILGVGSKAPSDDIKKAYRKLAMKWHPDLNDAPGATSRFLEINEAYEILSDVHKRKLYDSRLVNESRTRGMRPEDQAAYDHWVRQARARAQQDARKSYSEFKKSRFDEAEERVFFLLQYMILGFLCLLAVFIMSIPFSAMVYIHWASIFAALILVPVGFKILEEARKGFKSLKEYL